MSLKDFQVISKLGEGAFSSVYKVKRLTDDQEYALKKVKLLNLSEKERENALNEVRILASVKHPNLIAYKEAFLEESSNALCIVMEYCNNGDLYQKIGAHHKGGTNFSEPAIWNIFIQMVKGLKALHDMKIFHRDLKSANIFLNKDGSVKIGDLNVSKIAKKGLLYTQTGTPYYASPEVWKDKPYDNKSDIWSLGCVLYEMTTLRPPFRADNLEGLYKKVLRGLYPPIPSNFSQDLNNIIRCLLQVSPLLRPSCEKILQMSAIVKRLDNRHLMEVDGDQTQNNLLNTIKVPKNLHYLTERLPKPNYMPLKIRCVDKQKFLQTLADHRENSTNNSMMEEKIYKIGSISVDSNIKKNRESDNNDIYNNRNNNIHLPMIQVHARNSSDKTDILKIYGVNENRNKYKGQLNLLKQNMDINYEKNLLLLDKKKVVDQIYNKIAELDLPKYYERDRILKSREKTNEISNDQANPYLRDLNKDHLNDKYLVKNKNKNNNRVEREPLGKLIRVELSPIKGDHSLMNNESANKKKNQKNLDPRNLESLLDQSIDKSPVIPSINDKNYNQKIQANNEDIRNGPSQIRQMNILNKPKAREIEHSENSNMGNLRNLSGEKHQKRLKPQENQILKNLNIQNKKKYLANLDFLKYYDDTEGELA